MTGIRFCDGQNVNPGHDRLIEALVSETELVGYPRLQAALPGLLRPTPPDTLRAAWAWHDGLRFSDALADDVTMVVLQRRPK